jgi:hypothetical protein
MSGKLKAKSRFLSIIVLVTLLGGLIGACGEEPTVQSQLPTPLPTTIAPTNTPPPTSTPQPTPTPTEIPIVLPTPTAPPPNLPPTVPNFQQPFTPLPTVTENPTPRPRATATPYNPAIVVPLAVYQQQVPLFADLDRILPPSFSTRCIAAQYFQVPTPTPAPRPGISGTVTVAPDRSQAPLRLDSLATSEPREWYTNFETRWLNNIRLNTVRIPAPTFTPFPTNPPAVTAAPPNLPTTDVFTGQTPNPNPPTQAIPTPTARPIVPTSTPSNAARFELQGANEIRSIWITDVVSLLPGLRDKPINLVVMWHVMNDITLAMVNVDVPFENYLREYERTLDNLINTYLNFDLRDPRLPVTGERRYANRKILLGNVPNLLAFRFFKPCFTDERIRTVQNQYNQVIARVAAKYPNRVYVVDLSTLPWLQNPQWVTIEDGYRISRAGAEAVADAFGRVFERVVLTL